LGHFWHNGTKIDVFARNHPQKVISTIVNFRLSDGLEMAYARNRDEIVAFVTEKCAFQNQFVP
jgi:hypothetical protein